MARLLIGLVIGGVALLVGCTPTLADEAVEVCYPLCRCNDVPLPAEQEACTRGCIAQFEQNPPGDACVTCVVEHASRCQSLVDDCTPICTEATPRVALAAREARLQ